LIQVTQNCIDSARNNIEDHKLNIIVVETGNPYKYDVDKIIEYNGEFNYNRALNLGLKYAKGDIHILANNDIIFKPGWADIGDLMKTNGYHSASALSQDPRQSKFERGELVYEGYGIGSHLTGWCIFVDRFCLQSIGSLDEAVAFWYSDDIYVWQLKAAGIRHGLFCNIEVDHLTSVTLSKQSSNIQRKYQRGCFQEFNQRQKYYANSAKIHNQHPQDL
jgi:glycosyltransferase involved in cell wall biosynthesis